ncbi:MAG TPA: glycosyltransferase [Usitatibacter sp.]|jgi:glycosyltransferase involved in cell wall biosynthesis|nr:glycosyltransferase [Usitatibacter sp.]
MSAQPLRILHTESSLGWGGQEIRVLTEASGVARHGHAVLLAAPREARIFREAPRFGVEAVALPVARKGVRGVVALRRLLARGRFDVVNSHSSTDSWLAALALRSLGDGPALVRTRHISAPVPRNAATRWLYGHATRSIVTTGERLRAQVMDETGVAAARVVSIPTGIDLARFQPGDRAQARHELGLPAPATLIGIVATLRSWKGHRFLLEALAALERPGVHLVIVGDGPQREALGAQVDRLGIGARVLFAGNRDDVAPWLRAFDLFCLPSYANEGVPQSLMQAMACALPVVTTAVGSIPEIVADGINGVIVPAQDAPALAAALGSLLDDAPRRASLAARALADARERFGAERMVERMIDVFRAAARPADG